MFAKARENIKVDIWLAPNDVNVWQVYNLILSKYHDSVPKLNASDIIYGKENDTLASYTVVSHQVVDFGRYTFLDVDAAKAILKFLPKNWLQWDELLSNSKEVQDGKVNYTISRNKITVSVEGGF